MEEQQVHVMAAPFVRKTYEMGFRKVDPDRWEFANEHFLRDQKHLLKNIVRRRNHQSGGGGGGGGGCGVDVGGGKGGTAGTEISSEVESLTHERNAMAMDLMQLKQSQKAMDEEVREMNKRLQVTERRPQQMMAFLTKVVEDPAILFRISKGLKQQSRIATRGGRWSQRKGKRRRRLRRRRQLLPIWWLTCGGSGSNWNPGYFPQCESSGAF